MSSNFEIILFLSASIIFFNKVNDLLKLSFILTCWLIASIAWILFSFADFKWDSISTLSSSVRVPKSHFKPFPMILIKPLLLLLLLSGSSVKVLV